MMQDTLPSFIVYWQQPGSQLFAFTTKVEAPSARIARVEAGRIVARKGRVVGVKQSAGTALHTLHRGRWIG